MLKKNIILIVAVLILYSQPSAQEFEFNNNFLMNLSFITGTDRGIEQNLDDNFSWMQAQGYTHLRFFGIFTNGMHCFPSPTLDANGFPNNSYLESVLEVMMIKAVQYDIEVNFDGWEILAESNYDTTKFGVSYISPEELGQIVQEVLDLGVVLLSEEQFGKDYLQVIQSKTTAMGATHETTAGLWQQDSSALFADAQLVSVFSFFPRNQFEVDSIINAGHGYNIPATLGAIHASLESSRYFNIPTSVAVGSFGTLQTENWKNVLRFSQIQHRPNRFSIEEQNHSFLISNSEFNFMEYIGDELIALQDQSIGERPIANLIVDMSAIYSGSYFPAWHSSLVSSPAIVNTFTQLGYKVVSTVDSLLPEAEIYYVLLAGGTDPTNVAPLPDYILTLLEGNKPTFFQPTYGIPDDNDAPSWLPLREYFGLPAGETQTVFDEIPETVVYNSQPVKWGGIDLYLSPSVELLPSSQVDTSVSDVVVSGDVLGQETALIIGNGNSFLINSSVIHLEVSHLFSNLLRGVSNRPAGANIVIADGKGLIFAEYATEVDINLPWTGITQVRVFNPLGDQLSNFEIDLSGRYTATMDRGELVILIDLVTSCCVGIRGNVNADAEDLIDISDLVFLVDFIFTEGPTPTCPEEANIDGDLGEVIDISDLVALVDIIFTGGSVPSNCP